MGGFAKINNAILRKVRPGLFSKESLSKSFFNKSGLKEITDISASQLDKIKQALLDNWEDKQRFIDALESKDLSSGRLSTIFDTEKHLAEGKADLTKAVMSGKKTQGLGHKRLRYNAPGMC